MIEKNPPSVGTADFNDQTDLFEIISFFWRGKYFVFGSSIVGIIFALFFYHSNPNRDAATYIVPIEIQISLLENKQEAVQRFNENIGSYNHNSIVTESKDFSKNVFNLKVNIEGGFTDLHFSNSTIDKSGESQIQFAKALAVEIDRENLERESQVNTSNLSPDLQRLTEKHLSMLREAEKNFLHFSNEREQELAQLRTEIYKFVTLNYPRELIDCAKCGIEVLLNKALIANYYKIDGSESKKSLNEKIIKFFSLYGLIDAKYNSFIQDSSDSMKKAMLDKFIAIDLRKGLALSPSFSIDFTKFSKSKALNHQVHHTTTKPLFLGVGAILGFALGTLIYASAVFIRNNRTKLLAALK